MEKINWQNLPSTATPLNETNLNKMQTVVEDHFEGNTAMGSIKVASITNKNQIGGTVVGGINENTGVNNDGDTIARRTKYIPVNFNKFSKYTMHGLPTQKCSWYVAAYNSNKQFLGRTGAVIRTNQTEITLTKTSFTQGTPGGTGDIAYLRVTFYSPIDGYTIEQILNNYAQIQLEAGDKTNYVPTRYYGYGSGINANGSHTRFSDGRAVCSITLDKAIFLPDAEYSTTVQGIKIYRSGAYTWTFPARFINDDVQVVGTANTGLNGSRFATVRITGVTGTSCGVQVLGLEPFTSGGAGYANLESVSLIATGWCDE